MALDNSDFKCDVSRIYGGVSSVAGSLDPLSMGIDLIGGQLGLPPAVRNAAKLGIGALMGNPIAVVAGATGLAAEATKEEPASTQYAPKTGQDGKCTQGYASMAAPPPPQYGRSERFDMDSEAFAKWSPKDPYTKALHDQWLAARAGKCPNGLTEYEARRALETQLKYGLERNPAIRSDFEEHFGVKVVDANVDRPGSITVAPLLNPNQCNPSAGFNAEAGWRNARTSPDLSPHAGPWHAGGSSGNSGIYSPASVGGSDDGLVSSLRGELGSISIKDRIAELKKDGELSQEDMLEIQELMAKKQQLFTLISTIMSMQNQMSMAAIQNMKG